MGFVSKKGPQLVIPRTTPPLERIKWPAVRAISLTSAILPTRTCDLLVWGGRFFLPPLRTPGEGEGEEEGEGGGVYVQLLSSRITSCEAIESKRACFACKKRIWDHLIVSEDMDSIGEVESIIRALDNLRLIRSRSIYVLCCCTSRFFWLCH